MPKYEEAIEITGIYKEQALAIGYQAFKDLGWPVLLAGEDKVLANTPKSWGSNAQQVLIGVTGNLLTVCSEMVSGESFDIRGKNKKNVAAFKQAFENAKATAGSGNMENNIDEINALREKTVQVAVQEQQRAAEVTKALNLEGSNLYVTYGIIGLNVLIFILMVINGAGLIVPDSVVHIKWGSNYSPLTLSGDWWRLITNVFIHFGIIHLAMNMYCLYMVGIYLEPMLGKIKYTTAYLCTGILASIVSLWWHKDGINSAGASGAIFGMYGLFLALLTTNLIPKHVRQSLLQSIGIFVVYNLVYGVKSGVDNAAHVGGLLSGFVIGYIYVIGIKREQQQAKAVWVVPVVLLISIGIAATYLENNKETSGKRDAVLNEVRAHDYKDSEEFNEQYNAVVDLQDKAIGVFSDTLADVELQQKLVESSLPLWNKASEQAAAMQKMDVSEAMHKKAEALVKYIELRKEEIRVITDIVVNKVADGNAKLREVREKINAAAEKIK